MNRHSFVTSQLKPRAYQSKFADITEMHQCAFGSHTFGRPEIDNVRGHERCQTMLSEGSPGFCPEHNGMNHRYTLEQLRYQTGATTEQINEAINELTREGTL